MPIVINLPSIIPAACAQFSIIQDDLVEGDHAVTFVIVGVTPPDGIMINPTLNTHQFTIMDDNDGKYTQQVHQ